MASKQKLAIDIVSDVMCPWCWVGKRKLEAAMKQTADRYDFQIRWHPYLLRPEMPKEGVQKPPSTLGNPRVGTNLKEAGESVGINFTGRADRYPNTLQAHALLELAYDKLGSNGQNDVAEDLFQAYFTDGKQPTGQTLVQIGAKHGLSENEIETVINDDDHLDKIRSTAREWSRQGVTGVPSFYMNGGPTFSGAQDVATFTRIFDIVAQKRPLSGDDSVTAPASL